MQEIDAPVPYKTGSAHTLLEVLCDGDVLWVQTANDETLSKKVPNFFTFKYAFQKQKQLHLKIQDGQTEHDILPGGATFVRDKEGGLIRKGDFAFLPNGNTGQLISLSEQIELENSQGCERTFKGMFQTAEKKEPEKFYVNQVVKQRYYKINQGAFAYYDDGIQYFARVIQIFKHDIKIKFCDFEDDYYYQDKHLEPSRQKYPKGSKVKVYNDPQNVMVSVVNYDPSLDKYTVHTEDGEKCKCNTNSILTEQTNEMLGKGERFYKLKSEWWESNKEKLKKVLERPELGKDPEYQSVVKEFFEWKNSLENVDHRAFERQTVIIQDNDWARPGNSGF